MAYTTINKPTDYFNTKLYTGNGGTQSITGVGFQPDLNWIKNRSDGTSHFLYDIIRGAGNNKDLSSNSTGAEGSGDGATHGFMSAFTSDGFTVTQGSSTASITNDSGDTYASWNWLANGAGSANTAGSISSTVSANTTSGFSIVSYSGTSSNGTIGHGLDSAPKMVIVKALASGRDWMTYHKSVGATKYLFLNTTDASASSSGIWNDTDPTSTVVHLGSSNSVNGNGINYIAYCFAEVQGYSKVGSYTGGGSNFPFIYTGFKPAFVMIKRAIGGTNNWNMHDSKRSPFNPADERLYANLSNAENTGGNYGADFLSNGFKITTDDNGWNQSGDTYIYMTFAEAPLVGTNNVPCTAR